MKSDSGWVASNPLAVGANDFCSGTGKLGTKQSSQSWPQGWAPRAEDRSSLPVYTCYPSLSRWAGGGLPSE